MSTYTQILYQIIFTTKNRKNTLTKSKRPELMKFIWGILKNKKCHLYRINRRKGTKDLKYLFINILYVKDKLDLKKGKSQFLEKA